MNNHAAEIQAYDNLSLEYFYIGDINKAKIYQERMLRGKLEKDNSIIRSVCINMLNSKRERIQYDQKK